MPDAGPLPPSAVQVGDDGVSARLVVYGNPVAQSGTRIVDTARGKRGITTGGKGLLDWRQTVSSCAQAAALQVGQRDGPVALLVTFRFPMPKSRPKWMRDLGTYPKSTAPDVDKLLRAVCDSLKVGGLIADDALVQQVTIAKVEVWDGWTGALIDVAPARLPERP